MFFCNGVNIYGINNSINSIHKEFMKKSFAECNKCPFYEIDNKKICITNSQQDISSIDYLIITDNISEWENIEKCIKNDKL